jgi:hypothetical protein
MERAVPFGRSYAGRRYPWAICLKFRTVCFCQSPSRLSSRAINSATRGAASMLACAPSNRARVLRASTSSTVRPSLRAPPRQPRRRCRAVQGEALRPRLALAAQFPESQARRRRKRASSAPGWPAWSNHGSKRRRERPVTYGRP